MKKARLITLLATSGLVAGCEPAGPPPYSQSFADWGTDAPVCVIDDQVVDYDYCDEDGYEGRSGFYYLGGNRYYGPSPLSPAFSKHRQSQAYQAQVAAVKASPQYQASRSVSRSVSRGGFGATARGTSGGG